LSGPPPPTAIERLLPDEGSNIWAALPWALPKAVLSQALGLPGDFFFDAFFPLSKMCVGKDQAQSTAFVGSSALQIPSMTTASSMLRHPAKTRLTRRAPKTQSASITRHLKPKKARNLFSRGLSPG